MTLEEMRRRPAHPTADAISDAGTEEFLDPMYVHFEDIFRGTREEIRKRFEVYLPILKAANAGTTDMPVLDLGCGRGEWLELLSRNGMSGRGVDSNHVMVDLCRELKLSAERHDLLAYLRTLEPESLWRGYGISRGRACAVSVFNRDNRRGDSGAAARRDLHLRDTESRESQSQLLHLLSRPTYRNPVPRELLAFMLEARGLCQIETIIFTLSPSPTECRTTASHPQNC